MSTINEMIMAGVTLLDEDSELATFNAIEEQKNSNINSFPIEAWTEDLIISMLASLAMVAKNASAEKRHSIDLIIRRIMDIMIAKN